jgi:glycosyltransferase involved in cell wall biosynthesis
VEKPLVTVVIPTYNDSKEKLKKTICSVLTQTYTNLKIIVVDDGSDNPFSSLNSFIDDQRIVWLALAKNGGVAKARNEGLRMSEGAYIALLDAGDWWSPEKLMVQIELFSKEEGLRLVFSGATFYPENSEEYEVLPTDKKDWVNSLLVAQPIIGSASSVLFKKSVINEIGYFYDKCDMPEDRDYWLRIACLGGIGFVDTSLVHIELPTNSRSSDPGAKRNTYLKFIEINEALLKERGLLKQAYCSYHAAIAHKYFMKGFFCDGFSESVKAISYSLRGYVCYRVVIAVIGLFPFLDYAGLLFLLRSLKGRFF